MTGLTPRDGELVRAAILDLQRGRDWNQRETARAIGMSQPSLCGFLRGRWGISRPTAEKVATLCGTTLEKLLEGSEALSSAEPVDDDVRNELDALRTELGRIFAEELKRYGVGAMGSPRYVALVAADGALERAINAAPSRAPRKVQP